MGSWRTYFSSQLSRLKTSLFRSEKPIFVYFAIARRFLRGRLSLTTLDYDNPCSKGLILEAEQLLRLALGHGHLLGAVVPGASSVGTGFRMFVWYIDPGK